jgi:hypothetical protein
MRHFISLPAPETQFRIKDQMVILDMIYYMPHEGYTLTSLNLLCSVGDT